MQLAWREFVVGSRLKSGVDGGGGRRIEFFHELDAVI